VRRWVPNKHGVTFETQLQASPAQNQPVTQKFGKLAMDSKSARLSHDRYARSSSKGGSLAKWAFSKKKKKKHK
jgi:hypothetical protein